MKLEYSINLPIKQLGFVIDALQFYSAWQLGRRDASENEDVRANLSNDLAVLYSTLENIRRQTDQ